MDGKRQLERVNDGEAVMAAGTTRLPLSLKDENFNGNKLETSKHLDKHQSIQDAYTVWSILYHITRLQKDMEGDHPKIYYRILAGHWIHTHASQRFTFLTNISAKHTGHSQSLLD